VISVYGVVNLDLIGQPFSQAAAKQIWPSNSVYTSFTQKIVQTNSIYAKYTFNRHVVDKPGVNPGHGYGQTGNYISPIIQYYTVKHEPKKNEELYGVELYNSADNKTRIDAFCKQLNICNLSFEDAIRIYSNQLWGIKVFVENKKYLKESLLNQSVWLDIKSKNMRVYKVCYRFRRGKLYSLAVYNDNVQTMKNVPAGNKFNKNKNKDGLMDYSILKLNSCRKYYENTNEVESAFGEGSTERSSRVLKGIAKMIRKAEKGQVVFNKMAYDGIVFKKEIRTLKYPVSSHKIEYVSHDRRIKVVTDIRNILGSSYEFVSCVFVDLRVINNKDLSVANVGKIPSTRQLCYKQFNPVYECKRYDGKYSVTVFERNIAMLFTNEQTECASFDLPPVCGKEFFELVDFWGCDESSRRVNKVIESAGQNRSGIEDERAPHGKE